MLDSKRKLIGLILACLILTALLALTMVPSVSAATYNATVSGTDQQTVKGLGGGLPWPITSCGAPINNHSLAAQAVLDMGTSIVRVYIHNQFDSFDANGNLVNTALADRLVSQIRWAASHGIPYMYTPGWNTLPSSCYSGGYLLQQYEQALCNSVVNMINYFTSHGCALPLVTSVANEPNCPVTFMTTVPAAQFQRVAKMLRTTLNNAGLSNLKMAYPEAGEPGYTNMYLGGGVGRY